MPAYNFIANLVQIALLLFTAWLLFMLLRPSLQELLDQTIRLPAGTSFYLRSLLLVLLLVVLKEAVSLIHVKPEENYFMSYVWAIGSGLHNTFQDLFIVLLVFLGLITVLVAVLRPRHDE